MKKNCLLGALLAASILIVSVLSSNQVYDQPSQNSYDGFSSEDIEYWGLERLQNYRKAGVLINSFADSFPQDHLGNPLYPDYYGGSFFNSEGKVVLLIVEEALDSGVIRMLSHMEQEHSYLIIRPVSYSFNYLMDAHAYITYRVFDSEDIEASGVALHANSVGITVENDYLVLSVGMPDVSDEKIELFRRTVLDKPFIIFGEFSGEIYFWDVPSYDHDEMLMPLY